MKDESHPNAIWLIEWWGRLAHIVNDKDEMNASRDLCLDLARYMGEEGYPYPSDDVIFVAKKWEWEIRHGNKPWEWENKK